MLVIPFAADASMYFSFEIIVPLSSGFNVFFICIGIFKSKTGCTVGGYNTLAPK